MATKIRIRRATAAQAQANNVVLAEGELGYETDTYKIKIGRGKPWNETPGILDAIAPATPAGVSFSTAPGAPTVTNTSIAETSSTVNNNGTSVSIPTQTLTFALAATGKHRYDAIVVNYGATPAYERVAGVEVASTDTAPTPSIPANRLFVRYIKVTDGGASTSTPLAYTDEQAIDAVAAALLGGTHTNITVTYDDVANKINLATTGAGNTDLVPTDGSTNPVQSNGVFDALAGKEPTVAPGDWWHYYRGDKTWRVLDKAAVDLANVDNTSDANKPVSTAQQTALNAKADKDLSINTQTASYTLALTDRGGMVRMNVASANTLTVPANSAVAFPVGTQIVWSQPGAGQTTFVPGTGVTVNPTFSGGMKSAGQFAGGTLIKVDTDTWELHGNTTAL